MTYRGRQVPDHLLINIEQRDDPVSAVSEEDARHRSVAYPTIMWGAPVFGFAEEMGNRWRILRLDAEAPQHARDSLASHLRRIAAELPATPENAVERAECEAAYELLDWEAVNEVAVNGRRYRIIRAQPFIRMGPDGPEPPRPTDPDPYPPGHETRVMSHMEGFVIDPTASTGLTDGLLRMELVSALYHPDTVPKEVHADSRRALISHPNVVLLPVGYTVGECVAGSWRPRTATYPTPQAARDEGYFTINDISRDEYPTSDELWAAYRRFRATNPPPRGDDFEVRGVRCRVTRVEAFVRVGPDGPEEPRPSDPESHLPPARIVEQLREEGLLSDVD